MSAPHFGRRPKIFEQPTRRLFTAVAVMLVFSASLVPCALGARPATRHAGHRARIHRKSGRRKSHKRKAVRRTQAKPGAAVGSGGAQSASVPVGTLLLGEMAVQLASDSLPAGRAGAFRFRAAVTGRLGAGHLYISWQNAAATVKIGLYSDIHGHPGSLLSTGSAPASNGTWTTVPMAQTQLVSGTNYWLAILGHGGTLRYRDRRAGPCPSETSGQGKLGTLPSLWNPGSYYRHCPVSGYLTATSSAASEPPTLPLSPSNSPAQAEPPNETTPTPPAPTNTALPTVSGSAVEGQTLSASKGTWSGEPTSVGYQWEDCNAFGEGCLSIGGATASSYTLAASDVGGTVRVVVSASNAGGSTPATSAATATVVLPPAPTNTALPTVSGSAVEGQTLSASKGTWSVEPASVGYQWEDCNTAGESCSSIGGATASSYKLTASDVGHTLRVVVSASNAGGSTPATSAATATVVLPPAPTNTALPTVSGSAVEGQTLSASKGTWSVEPTSVGYQWEDCNTAGESCSSIGGATASSYKLTASDVGHTLRVVVSASNAGGSTPATSAATATVLARGSHEYGTAHRERVCRRRPNAQRVKRHLVGRTGLGWLPVGGLQHGG